METVAHIMDFEREITQFLNTYGKDHKIDFPALKGIRKGFKGFLKEALENGWFAHFKYAIEYWERKEFKRRTNIYYADVKLRSGKKAKVSYKEGGYIISTDPNLEPHKKRMIIGHELGHILISLLRNKIHNPDISTVPLPKEILASLFCLMMHIDQSEFYQGDLCKKYCYSEDDYLQLFEDICEIAQSNRPWKN